MSEYIIKSDVRHLLLHNDRNAALAKLDELEAVDAVPVVHGAWDEDFIYLVCSVCGERCSDSTLDDYRKPNYCPNCGAKMGGMEHNEH